MKPGHQGNCKAAFTVRQSVCAPEFPLTRPGPCPDETGCKGQEQIRVEDSQNAGRGLLVNLRRHLFSDTGR